MKKIFWVILILVILGGGYYALKYYSKMKSESDWQNMPESCGYNGEFC